MSVDTSTEAVQREIELAGGICAQTGCEQLECVWGAKLLALAAERDALRAKLALAEESGYVSFHKNVAATARAET